MLKFNDQNEVIREEEYKAILVGVQLGEDISYSMEELKGLCEAASVESIDPTLQLLWAAERWMRFVNWFRTWMPILWYSTMNSAECS